METSRGKRILLTLLDPKVGIPLALVLAVLSAPLVFRGHQIAGLPDPGDPFDVEAFGTVEIAPAENAFVEYRLAVVVLVPPTPFDPGVLEKAMKGGWSAASQEIRKWVSDNRAALDLWRKGSQKPDAVYYQPKDMTIAYNLEVVQQLRDFAQLARLEGARLEHAGDFDAAREWYRAMFRSSRHCGRHGVMIERLVGIGIHRLAAEVLQKWAGHPQVDVALLRRALDEVIADYQMTPATSTMFKAEYIMAMNTLNRPDLPLLLGATAGFFPIPKAAMFLMNEPELSVRVSRHIWANWLSEIDRPLHARSPRYAGSLPLFVLRRKID